MFGGVTGEPYTKWRSGLDDAAALDDDALEEDATLDETLDDDAGATLDDEEAGDVAAGALGGETGVGVGAHANAINPRTSNAMKSTILLYISPPLGNTV